MKLPEITQNEPTITEYINWLELQDKKPKTIENKVWGIVPFLSHIGEKDVRSVTKMDVESFMLSLKKSGKKPSSIHMYTFNTRFFLNWVLPGNGFFENVKVKRPKTDHSKDAFVDIKDVRKMLQACKHQRDRAFLFLMWESAGRLEEVLQLNVEDAVPEKNGITVHLRGKTGERDVLVIDAVPDLMSWLNLYRGERGQPLFPATTGNRLSHTGAQSLVERIAKRAGITEKRVFCHSFRHGRVSELANMGMTEMQLRLFAGWQNDSEMPATYIHTKKKDVYSKLLKLKGIEPEEEEINVTATSPKKCPACGVENPFDAVVCYKCRAILDSKLAVEIAVEETRRKQEIEQLKSEIAELKKAKQEREAAIKEFEPVFEEGRKQREIVEELTGMSYEEAAERFDIEKIVPESEILNNFSKRLATDKEYRERWKKTRPARIEKKEQELGKRAIRVLELKTLADELN